MWRAQATCHFLKCFHLPLEKYSYDITLKLTNQCCDQSTHSSKVSGSVFLQHSSKVKWCVVDIFCSMRQSLLHFGVEQETDVTLPPVRDPPPHPSPDTHTFKQFSACRGRVLFQRLVTWSVFNWGSFNRTRGLFSPDFNPQYIPQTYSDNWSDIRQPQALNDPDFVKQSWCTQWSGRPAVGFTAVEGKRCFCFSSGLLIDWRQLSLFHNRRKKKLQRWCSGDNNVEEKRKRALFYTDSYSKHFL